MRDQGHSRQRAEDRHGEPVNAIIEGSERDVSTEGSNNRVLGVRQINNYMTASNNANEIYHVCDIETKWRELSADFLKALGVIYANYHRFAYQLVLWRTAVALNPSISLDGGGLAPVSSLESRSKRPQTISKRWLASQGPLAPLVFTSQYFYIFYLFIFL